MTTLAYLKGYSGEDQWENSESIGQIDTIWVSKLEDAIDEPKWLKEGHYEGQSLKWTVEHPRQ